MLAQFIPHGHCYLWKTNLLGLNLISDLLIALSYYSIPITLVYFVRKREDLPYSSIFLLFGAFIISCGTSHLMEIWTLWHPSYWVSGIVKAITALISLYTAIEMFSVVPLALNLPSSEQLQIANNKLEAEIIEHKQTEVQLEKEQVFIKAMLDNLSDGIVACDENGILALFNQASQVIFDMPQEPIPPEQWSEYYNLYYPDGKTHLKQNDIPLFRAFSGESFTNAELMAVPKQGKERTLLANGSPIVDTKGVKIGAVIAVRDISDRKAAETKITQSLQEKEVLLQEIHHRVKNNLQVICSLLNLQSRYLKEEKIIKSFKETQNRVKSMALVHEQLYQSDNLSQIVLLDYIKQLTNNLFRAYSTTYYIECHTEIDEFYLDLDLAVPCGLIINEIVSNAIKYAFCLTEKGKISIKAFADRAKNLVLIIEDNGQGLKPDFDLEKSKSLGLKLVKTLTNQLQGELKIHSDCNSGTRFKFTFNRIKQQVK